MKIFLLFFISYFSGIYIAYRIGEQKERIRFESEVNSLQRKADSLQIDNAELNNDVLLLKTKCELYEYELWMK